MPLNPPVPRLRVVNKSAFVAKFALAVQPGDDLEVSADVAAQLDAQRAPFVEVAKPKAKKAAKKS